MRWQRHSLGRIIWASLVYAGRIIPTDQPAGDEGEGAGGRVDVDRQPIVEQPTCPGRRDRPANNAAVLILMTIRSGNRRSASATIPFGLPGITWQR
jgi:hypothetical protein